MASTIKVNNIQNQCGTDIIKRCGTTTTVGSGASNTIVMCGSTVTIGRCGGTVQLAAGATQSGFGRTGTVDWDTTAKTGNFTAVSGTGYFVNTTSGAITLTLPASPSAGDIVAFKDYAFTFATNNLTVDGNGSPIGGVDGSINPTYNTNGTSKTFIYVDGTKGWLVTNESTDTSQEANATYIVATGGTITTCGNYKIHTFTGPGTFTVCSVGNPSGGPNSVDYLVVAGGGGGGASTNKGVGGGGAGGYRTSYPSCGAGSIPVSATAYPITVGSGGSGGSGCSGNRGNNGSNSIFSTITSAGGGGGGQGDNTGGPGFSGGSGGGGGYPAGSGAGSGNTPPVSPPQGNNGGSGGGAPASGGAGGGGGGAGAAGTVGNYPGPGGPGGNGLANLITGSSVTYAGGGGASSGDSVSPRSGTGGTGGGGAGAYGPTTPGDGGGSGTANTGGGGGGGQYTAGGGSGGSGIVIIRYKYQ